MQLLVFMKSSIVWPFQGSRHMDHAMPKDLQGQEVLSSPGQGDGTTARGEEWNK